MVMTELLACMCLIIYGVFFTIFWVVKFKKDNLTFDEQYENNL